MVVDVPTHASLRRRKRPVSIPILPDVIARKASSERETNVYHSAVVDA